MSWVRFLWLSVTELILLAFVIGLLIKIFITNSKKIDLYSQKMWDSTRKAQAFLQQADHEFAVMNRCAKSIKQVFLNFGKLYTEISDGKKTLDDALREAKMSLPEKLRNDSSSFFFLTEDGVTESTAVDEQYEIDSCSDIADIHSKSVLSDSEQRTE